MPLVTDRVTTGFIPFPIVKHKKERGEIMFEYCKSSDILFPEFLIPVAGHGIPFGDLETAARKYHFWLMVSRAEKSHQA